MSITMATGRSAKQQQNFTLITLPELIEHAHHPKDLTSIALDADGKLTSVKPNFPWLMPNDCQTGKTRKAVEAHNNFTALIADIDEGNMSLLKIKQRLEAVEIGCYVIYATASASPGAMRWRVVVPFARPCELAQWRKLTHALTQMFGGDACMERATQISFLPVLTAINQGCYQHATS